MGKIITVLVGISKIDVLASTEFVYNPNSNYGGTPIPVDIKIIESEMIFKNEKKRYWMDVMAR